MSRLTQRLNIGGVLLIIDSLETIRAEDHGHNHSHGHAHAHHHVHTHSTGSHPTHDHHHNIIRGKTVDDSEAQTQLAAMAETAAHKSGFSRHCMEAMFTAARCTNFGFMVFDRPVSPARSLVSFPPPLRSRILSWMMGNRRAVAARWSRRCRPIAS